MKNKPQRSGNPGWLSQTMRVLIACLLLQSVARAQEPHVHTWKGGYGPYMSIGGNWQGNNPPEVAPWSTARWCQLQFGLDFSSPFKTCTNSYNGVLWHSLVLGEGGYLIGGYALGANWILDKHAPGSDNTLALDILPHIHDPANPYFEIVTKNSGARLNIDGDIIVDESNYSLFPTNTLYVYGAGDVVLRGGIRVQGLKTKPCNLIKTGEGVLYLEGSRAFVYATVDSFTVKMGTLRLQGHGIYETNGIVTVGTDLIIGSGTVGPTEAFVLLDFDNQLAGSVTVNGSGELNMLGHNDAIAGLSLNCGHVVTAGGILSFRKTDSGIQADAGSSLITGKVDLGEVTTSDYSRMVQVSTGATLHMDAVVSGQTGVTLLKRGPGELMISGANTYTGPTRVEEGVLTLQHNQALGSTLLGTTLAGGDLRLYNVAIVGETLSVEEPSSLLSQGTSNFWRGAITLNASLTAVVSNASTLVLSNSITGGGGLAKLEGGELRLTGPTANTYAGLTRVSSGTLLLAKAPGQSAVMGDLIVGDGTGGVESDVVRLDADEQISDLSAVEVTASGMLDLGQQRETIRSLTGAGTVLLGSGYLTVSNDLDHVFDGTIRGGRDGYAGAELSKKGTGTWTLTGSNAYWGATYVEKGTLLVNGTLVNSDTTIGRGAVLGGSGTVQRVEFRRGSGSSGVLSPGAPIGQLVAQGSVFMANGSLQVELNGPAPGSGYDQLITATAPNLTGISSDPCSLKVIPGFAPTIGDRFVIIDNRAAKPIGGTFADKPEGAVFVAGGLLFQISYAGGTGNDAELTYLGSAVATDIVAGVLNAQFRVQAHGVPGETYVLEAAPDMNAPISWQPALTNAADGTGLLEFLDTDMPTYPQRFYRIRSPLE